MNAFPKLILEFRERKEMTKERLAELCCVTRMTMYRWEIGKSAPSRLAIHKLKELRVL